ncbi:bifunctional hydroxymethylpyrimidine kinase/phosphomethylpyrimidine kinase [Taibaiella sp. KBW10]|uniref:bifunctional hydroxymethylpyrimidine kinase/phosphomethylpyrimidine kinase n=1 Tax=Taibaiella sp. KBW10 TaxID=2153357 RepID=UPI000F5B61A4|nr:bifunctional hydroxymethylpyrimidine kinase/phosphomethylpyrimidine kinase [Taibaiella sp. KBW10]RQO32615.1 bifunctional hydroxymethylpyrimidine kinase/phosphomethylpyrimidine kinase [Taibaiella sp. KBW10]
MNPKYRYPIALTIAGFDGSGGAGIQADCKTFSALGCYATSILTALPVQNTQGVKNIYPIPCAAVEAQIGTILDDIFPDAIKIGMVHTAALVQTIAAGLTQYPQTPLILDPVMVSSSGHRLIEDRTIAALIDQLFPIAELITPNMDEAAVLAEMEIKTLDDMFLAGTKIQQLGCRAVLLKGGHLDLPEITSLYFDTTGQVHAFRFEKYNTQNTHGTGCTLSAAIAAYRARGKNLAEAINLGQNYVQQAIAAGSDVRTGKGHGPLNHFFQPEPLIKYNLP